MNQKVGIADSGIAIALISVARQSRRNRKTTTTASTAPSTIAAIELRYCSLIYSVRVNRLLKSTLGRSVEHTSELQSLMSMSYVVFCLKTPLSNIKHQL